MFLGFKSFKISLINILKFPHLNVSLPMGFDVFSPTVLDIQIWAYFDLILEKGQGLTILKKCFQKLIINLKKANTYWIWSFCHSWNIAYRFDSFSAQLWLYYVTSIEKFQNFGKMTEDQFFHLKKYKFRILYCCLVAIHCFETALKNFGKWRQREAPDLHLPPNIS